MKKYENLHRRAHIDGATCRILDAYLAMGSGNYSANRMNEIMEK